MGLLEYQGERVAQDNANQPLPRARRHVYILGRSTLAPIYSDPHLKYLQANPMIADQAGNFVQAYLEDGTYRIVLEDEHGRHVRTHDNMPVTSPLSQSRMEGFNTVTDLFSDATLVYGGGQGQTPAQVGEVLTAEGGQFAFEIAEPEATDHQAVTAGGVKLRTITRKPTPFHFGAVGDGVTDDGPALQAFFDMIQTVAFDSADISGDFATSIPLHFGATGAGPATRKIQGHMDLRALDHMNAVLTLTDCSGMEWDSLHVEGTGATNWGTRGCAAGVCFDNCGRQLFRKISARKFAFAGLCAMDNNNSLSQFGEVKVTDCGSGKVGYSMTGTWSAKANSGSSGSTSQSTTLTVDTLPPDYVINGTFGTVGDAPYLVRIEGRLHFITAIDVPNGQLTVYPWVKSSATPGGFEYVFGAGVYLRGNDCNVNMLQSVDAIRCGVALAATSLYGPQANRIVTQLCGIGILIGRQPAGASLGGQYENIYFENNDEDIILLMRTGTNAYNYFGAEYALNLAKVYCMGAPRQSNDLFSTGQEGFQRQILSIQGQLLQYEKQSRSASSSSFTLAPERRDQTTVYDRNTITVNLDALNPDINRLTGIDSAMLVMLGTGANRQPTGTVTFSPPPGWTLNGGTAQQVFSNFTHPPMFVAQWQIGTFNVVLSHINGRQAPAVPAATAGSAAEINALRDALISAGFIAAS